MTSTRTYDIGKYSIRESVLGQPREKDPDPRSQQSCANTENDE